MTSVCEHIQIVFFNVSINYNIKAFTAGVISIKIIFRLLGHGPLLVETSVSTAAVFGVTAMVWDQVFI